MSKDEADKISRGIRLAAESAGIIAQISQRTNINEGIYGSMLEGSFKNGMLSGIGNLTTYAIGGLVK